LVLRHLAFVITTLATPQATVVVTLGAAGWLSRLDTSSPALKAVTLPLVALTVSVLAGKALLHRPGPPGSHLHHLLGYYPSGHTATAVVCTGLLTRLATQRRPGLRHPLCLVSVTWTSLVGTSLVIHHYHWLSDVVAGLLLGSLILLTTRTTRRRDVAAGAWPATTSREQKESRGSRQHDLQRPSPQRQDRAGEPLAPG
jgi:membrane-associated phospholipid phosphatase